MVDINKLFPVDRQLEEMKRHDKLFGRFDEELSRIKQQERLFGAIDIARHSLLDQHRSSFGAITDEYFQNIGKAFASTDHLKIVQQAIGESYAGYAKALESDSLKSVSRMMEEYIRPFSASNLLAESVKGQFEQIYQSLASPNHFLESGLFHDLAIQSRATALSSFEALAKPIFENHALLRNQDFIKQFSASVLAYDQFTNNTIAKLSAGIDKSIALALKGSVTLASEQMLWSSSFVQSYATEIDVSDFDKSIPFIDRTFPKENRYRVQKRELLKRNDIEEDESYESLVDKSLSATIFEQVVECMLLVAECNEAAETTSGEKIFKLTNTSWSSSWILQKQVATNKESLRTIVESLYFIFYEGAGSKNLRFLTKGYLTDDEAKIMFVIKHLRNKWLSHDVEHGDASSIKRDYKHRKEALEWLGFERMPSKAEDFTMLNSYLMSELNKFLKLLLERVSKFSN